MNIRIYKDNLRENIFRSLLFTDVVIFIVAGVVVALFVYVLFFLASPHVNLGYYLSATAFSEITLYALALVRIDNQSIVSILSRATAYMFGRKTFRSGHIDAYFRDFTIQDNLIMCKKSISTMFAITPFDISAINTAQKKEFFINVKQALHNLPAPLQIIIRKEKTTVQEITEHFFHLYSTLRKGDKRREAMITSYQQDLSEFIKNQGVLTIKHYGVFSIKSDTGNPTDKVTGIGKLTDMYKRFSSSLDECNIATRLLKSDEIKDHIASILR